MVLLSVFFLKGKPMDRDRILEDRAYAIELDAGVRADHPCHAGEARELMNAILRRADRQKFLVFNGEAIDRHRELGELATTHRFVASLLECRDKGQPVTGWYLEGAVRASLGLGFAVIKGGKA